MVACLAESRLLFLVLFPIEQFPCSLLGCQFQFLSDLLGLRPILHISPPELLILLRWFLNEALKMIPLCNLITIQWSSHFQASKRQCHMLLGDLIAYYPLG